MKCLQCGSSDIIRDGKLQGHGYIRLEFYDNPDALMFKGTTNCLVSASVCTKCGFIMNHVSKHDLTNLRYKFDSE